MRTEGHLPTRFILSLLCAFVAGTSAAAAEQYCYPHCDYVHYYGPFDLSYIQPGLFGWPRCGLQGDCAPHLAYTTVRRGRITVRLPRAMPATRRP